MNKTLGWIIVAAIILIGGFFVVSGFQSQKNDEYVYPTNENGAHPYIHLFDWPPQVNTSDDPVVCVPAGEVTKRAGRTESRIVNGREYCVTEIAEGAAGSMYTQYAYLTKINNKTVAITFTVKAVQCLNYEVPEQSICQEKQKDFDVDRVVDHFVKEATF